MLTKTHSVDTKHALEVPAGNTPLLASIREFRRQLGDIGQTAAYAAIKRHRVQVVRLGGRSLVPMAEIQRVVDEISAARTPDSSAKAKALAALSVEARRSRRGDCARNRPPKRRRRGSTEP